LKAQEFAYLILPYSVSRRRKMSKNKTNRRPLLAACLFASVIPAVIGTYTKIANTAKEHRGVATRDTGSSYENQQALLSSQEIIGANARVLMTMGEPLMLCVVDPVSGQCVKPDSSTESALLVSGQHTVSVMLIPWCDLIEAPFVVRWFESEYAEFASRSSKR
jgi:hypothetical protein